MKILKRYKCVKSDDESRFAVGEIYPLYKDKRKYIVSNNNVMWFENEFPIIEEEWGVELVELKEENKTLDLNNLTTEQLFEYVDLTRAAHDAVSNLNDFIERMRINHV